MFIHTPLVTLGEGHCWLVSKIKELINFGFVSPTRPRSPYVDHVGRNFHVDLIFVEKINSGFYQRMSREAQAGHGFPTVDKHQLK